MTDYDNTVPEMNFIDPALLLDAYAQGIFPMADDASDAGVFWVRPEKRCILPIDNFHISRSLAKIIRRQVFDIFFDTDFSGVIEGCAEKCRKRPSTWINAPIRRVYTELFDLGHCHTIEARRNGKLVGGLYGLSLGLAFFGESMFSRERDASKVCLVALMEKLRNQGFVLLDAQFMTPHLERFGAIEISRQEYEKRLKNALASGISSAHFT